MRHFTLAGLATLARLATLGLLVAGCPAPPLSSPAPPACDLDACITSDRQTRTKVDLLFVIDNTPSMAAKQAELRSAFPRLLAQLDRLALQGSPVSYHIGVVTSDLGAGAATLDAQHCHPNGDDAQLQVAPAADAADVPVACASFSLGGGVRYLDYDQPDGTTNIQGGLDLATAFDCMAAVGTSGCTFPQPLEATYRALHDPIAANQGFLRADAALAIVFVSDVDDCSTPIDSDLFDPSAAGVARYGALHPFRCTQHGIQCNGQPVPATPVSGLTGCESQQMADGGKLLDLDRYVSFFTRPAAQGGVKVYPDDVMLVGITAPPDPVGVTVTSPCADAPGTASCPLLNHSCVAATDPQLSGDPAVRLASVIQAARHNDLTSVCDTSYAAPIDALGNLISAAVTVGCFGAPVAHRADGTPSCTVEDVTVGADGSVTATPLPLCGHGVRLPCWQLDDLLSRYQSQGCTPPGEPLPSTCLLPVSCQPVTAHDGSLELYRVEIMRAGEVPPHTTTSTSCEVER